jgi:hypothetical protein
VDYARGAVGSNRGVKWIFTEVSHNRYQGFMGDILDGAVNSANYHENASSPPPSVIRHRWKNWRIWISLTREDGSESVFQLCLGS